MMKKIVPLISFCFFYASFSQAQFTRFLVKFKNKGNNPYSLSDPSAYLSQRAIDRRTRYNISIDSVDLPVTPGYISQVTAVPNVIILNTSKWLNQVSVQTTDANAINAIAGLPFVQNVTGIGARIMPAGNTKRFEEESGADSLLPVARIQNTTGDYYDYGANSFNEMHLHHGEFLHNIGLRGEGMQTALIDAGFYNYDTFNAFDSMNINGQVLATWDFVARESSVAEDYSHGMLCLSTIAANLPGQFVGTAPKTSFYLYRTEDVSSEYPIEEHNWVCGAEKADSSGADVISSSLGYTNFDNTSLSHTYAELDGHTTMASKGAVIAAKKGLLLFIAAGNEGNNTWHYIMTPADADSVITVGAVDTAGVKGIFSSFGPTADGRIKPDVVSVGVKAIIETSYNSPGISQGTSFACPKMAGLGTCLWQGFPEFNNIKIINALKRSGSAYSRPTDSLGYGIPDLKLAFTNLLIEFATSTVSMNHCNASLSWTSKDVDAMKYEIERKIPGETSYTKISELNPQTGIILANHSYQFTDTLINVNAGTLSYRIKQIVDTSLEGFSAAYIDTANITMNADCHINTPVASENKITVSPNPIHDELNLVIETATAIPSLMINVYDMHGRLMLQMKETKAAGKTTFTIPTARLANGKYNIVVYDAQKRVGTVGVIKL
ncbi:MAG: family serine peptidase [Chitinophagaceae bacterium]|nr:family serine peptidase [Chitinophagaceae bacterium]